MTKEMKLLIDKVRKELFDIPYLCPFCSTTLDENGLCQCDCHECDKHIEAYEKQLKERLEEMEK